MEIFARHSEDSWRHSAKGKISLLILDNKPIGMVVATILFDIL